MGAPSASAPQEASRRHFDRWKGVYSRSRILASLQRQALAELDPRSDDRVLDVACGAGKLVREIAPRVESAVGVDLAPGMIDEARRRTAEEAPELAGRTRFEVAPSDSLPFADGEFTAVVCTTAFHHFPDPEGSVREMARVLEPGGRLLIGDSVRERPSARLGDAVLRRFERGHVGLQSLEGFERLFADAGLDPRPARTVWRGLYAFVGATKR